MSASRLGQAALLLVFLAMTRGGAALAGRASAQDKGPARPIPVAIIPFVNASEDAQADQKVLGVLIAQFLATRAFVVTEPGVVETVLAELRVRGQLDAGQMKQVAEKTGARLLLMGTITEYGQSRMSSGGVMTVAMNARLVDALSLQIVWAGTVTRTEKEREGFLFGSQTPSLSKLTQRVVLELVRTMTREYRPPAMAMAPAPAASPGGTGGAAPGAAGSPDGGAAPAGTARFLDEARELTIDDLKALLPAVDGTERSEVSAVEQCANRVQASYTAPGTAVWVTLADYGKADSAAGVVRVKSAEMAEARFEDLPAFSGKSDFDFAHLNIAAGRFGLYLRAPSAQEELMRKVASAILNSLR